MLCDRDGAGWGLVKRA